MKPRHTFWILILMAVCFWLIFAAAGCATTKKPCYWKCTPAGVPPDCDWICDDEESGGKWDFR